MGSVCPPGLGRTLRAYPEAPRVSSLGAAHIAFLPRDMLGGSFVHRGYGDGCEQWWVVAATSVVPGRLVAGDCRDGCGWWWAVVADDVVPDWPVA